MGKHTKTKKSKKDLTKKRESVKKQTEKVKVVGREKNKQSIKSEFDSETEAVIQMTNRNRIKKEQQIKKQNNVKEKNKQKRNKKVRIFFELTLSLLLIVGSIIFALTSPIFNIKEINVVNNKLVAAETIVSLSELKYDENIFKFNENLVCDKIKENPYIESVSIKRNIPNKIEINVKERQPKYSLDYMEKYVYITNQGYMLEISENNNNGLPIIYGSETSKEEITIGKRLNKEDLDKLEDVIKIMSAATESGLENKITSIDISDKNDYIIYVEEQKKKIHLGDVTNLSNKMLYILAIMEQESQKEGEIFVNGDLNNKFQPYFREKV